MQSNCILVQVFATWSLLLHSSTQNRPSHYGKSTFAVVYGLNSGSVCAADPPIASINVTDGPACSWNCIVRPLCESFNYNSNTKRCDIYFHKPSKFVSVPSCTQYQLVKKKPRDCYDLMTQGFNHSGVYVIYPDAQQQQNVTVYCDMETDGGGWIVFQSRNKSRTQENFNRVWTDYENGFGNWSGEFWLGNRYLNLITTNRKQRLRIDLTNSKLKTGYACYFNMTVDTAANKYRIMFDSYAGNIGDSFSTSKGRYFSTKDQNNDAYHNIVFQCAQDKQGGWWFNRCPNIGDWPCDTSSLNGFYYNKVAFLDSTGFYWSTWNCQGSSFYQFLYASSMKMRPMDAGMEDGNLEVYTPPKINRRDCFDLYELGFTTSGVYQIYPDPDQTNMTSVYCDMTTEGGGWTVFQRRSDGSESFQRGWNDYETGFGNVSDEYWLGNRYLNWLTSSRNQKLTIDMIDHSDQVANVSYSNFTVGNSAAGYKMNFSSFSQAFSPTTIDDSLSYDRGSQFSTIDRDPLSTGCPSKYHGGWWYTDCPTTGCYYANLNGVMDGYDNFWSSWHCYAAYSYTGLKYSQMRLKPMNFSMWP